MQDYLHFGQLGTLFKLLRPFARTLGPWPFVVLVLIVLAFISFASYEFFGLAHDFLHIVFIVLKAALAAFFIVRSLFRLSRSIPPQQPREVLLHGQHNELNVAQGAVLNPLLKLAVPHRLSKHIVEFIG